MQSSHRSRSMKDGTFGERRIPLDYHSQWRDVVREEWRPRACGIAVLAMMLEYAKPGRDIPDLDRLIDDAVARGAHDPAIGWIHARLIALANEFDVALESRVYRAKAADEEEHLASKGLAEIAVELSALRPVIASVRRGFSDAGTPHMVVLSGAGEDVEGKYFLVHDPDSKSEEGAQYRRVSREQFEKNWRKLAIFWKHSGAARGDANSPKNPLK